MTVRRFEPLEVPLSGRNLVEAGAGTGKTWSITALYLRLLLEQQLTVEQVLVVTYTRAATAELQERIRQRLQGMRKLLRGGSGGGEFELALLDRMEDREQALLRTELALRSLDLAPIHTIHGYCQRVLQEHAFLCGSDFGLELATDTRSLEEELLADFWRTQVAGQEPAFLAWLRSRGLHTPSGLARGLLPFIRGAPVEIEPSTIPPHQGREGAWKRCRADLGRCWRQSGQEPLQLLLAHGGLNRRSHGPGQIEARWRLLERALAEGEGAVWPDAALREALAYFSSGRLTSRTNKGARPPAHPFFDLCGRCLEALAEEEAGFEARLLALRRRLIEEGRTDLERRKRRHSLLGYEDLLLRLHRALEGASGRTLAGVLRQRHPAALIDEFQDTDPLQYAIFDRIYPGEGDGCLYLVGDPKQSIYAFRGADVFSYLQGREEADRVFCLEHNWRSVPSLLRAVNHLFGRHPDPFLSPAIRYRELEPGGEPPGPLTPPPPASLEIALLPREGTKPLSKERAGALAAAHCAAEVAALLEAAGKGLVRIGGRPLEGRDVAVLVHTHVQGAQVQAQLRLRGVASAICSGESVYHSHEAGELERVLQAVAEPRDGGLLRTALATDMLGWSGEAIAHLNRDDQRQLDLLEQFLGYHACWLEEGPVVMLGRLLREQGVAARLLRFPDGERRLTNLFHLAELLQAQRHRTTPTSLLSWLAERRRESPDDPGEAQLRLESDERLVRIVTIHKSKGLEYPVVFCPFFWSATARTGEVVVCHETGRGRVLDLGSAALERRRDQAWRESLGEQLRLLYVALTRAEQRCVVYWGVVNRCLEGAGSWLLWPLPERGPRALAEWLPEQADEALLEALRTHEAQAPGAIGVRTLPAEPEERRVRPAAAGDVPLEARSLPPAPAPSWRLTSFSALLRDLPPELPDHDAAVLTGEPLQAPAGGIHAFPRGPVAGSCLHAILEQADFRATPMELAPLVERTLAAWGFGAEWGDVVSAHLAAVLATPLEEEGPVLRAIGPEERLAELPFTFSCRLLEPQRLRERLGGCFREESPRLAASAMRLDLPRIRGYMKGYIDLVYRWEGRYWLLDYKSNWLGPDSAAYGPEALERVIAEEHYYLQYLIYAVALHRYLRRRLPEYDYRHHFGGIHYLFLRGMEPGRPGWGVWADRPPAALIGALDELLGKDHG